MFVDDSDPDDLHTHLARALPQVWIRRTVAALWKWAAPPHPTPRMTQDWDDLTAPTRRGEHEITAFSGPPMHKLPGWYLLF
jgi:hypothetical protein